MATSCPSYPVPLGWRIWRGAVPQELTLLAISVRDHVRSYPMGSIQKAEQYQGQTVGVFVSMHTWTYRDGKLITGICIPGCALVTQPTGVGATAVQDSLDTPDPNAVVFDSWEQEQTDWPLVLISGIAVVSVCALFALAIRHAGRAAGARPPKRLP